MKATEFAHRSVLVLGVLLLSVGAASAKRKPKGPPPPAAKALPRVLLIGDSICGGYHKGVAKALEGKAEVVKPADNGRDTWRGLEKLDEWLGDGKWDVIHFNWGLWDVARRNPKSMNFGHLDKVDGKLTTTLRQYEVNLRRLVVRLSKTGATLVWASTTPIPDGEPGRIKGDAARYNAVAARIMAAHGIAVNDLHAYAVKQGFPKRPGVGGVPDVVHPWRSGR